MASMNRTPESTIVAVELANGQAVEVLRMSDGTYDVRCNNVTRHTPCSAEDAMRALGHYLASESYQLAKLRNAHPEG
jgi:hypothetical protein